MVKNHLKSITMPKTWQIERKKTVFVTRPNPGAHPMMYSMPLNIVMKELIKCAKTTKEVKAILHDKEVLVDGKKRNDEKYSVGLMDVVSLPETKQNYRIIINQKGKLKALEIPKEEANIKLSKVENKTVIKKGKIQLNLSDGRNIIVEKDSYKTGDSLVVALPTQEIKDTINFKPGMTALLIGGKHIGFIGKVEDVKSNIITIKIGENSYETLKDYAFMVGKDKPIITLDKK